MLGLREEAKWYVGGGYSTNTILDSEDNTFYISYNPKPMFLGSDNGSDETALIWRDPWKCLIINGDWRKEYEEIVPKGYQACLDFYHSKSEFRSSWSED